MTIDIVNSLAMKSLQSLSVVVSKCSYRQTTLDWLIISF